MHNSKEIVNVQGLFLLTVGHVDMITYPVTKYYYIIERVYFIYWLFILFISKYHSCCFYIQHHGVIREMTSMPV